MEKLEFDMVKEKIEKVKNRQYITSDTVISLPTLFFVSKGYSDTRLVYELPACGLNEALWDNKLWIPFVYKVLDPPTQSSWFGDVDYAEMFHNYKL